MPGDALTWDVGVAMQLFAQMVTLTAATVLACWGSYEWAQRAANSDDDGPSDG